MLLNYNCLRWQSRIGFSSHFGTVVLAAMTNLGCQCDAPGKRDPQLENHLHQTGLWACSWGSSLIADWCVRAKSRVNSSDPGQVEKRTPVGYPIPSGHSWNIHTSNIIQAEQAAFRNVYVYTCNSIILKKAMNFKERKEEYTGGLGGRKWKGEMKEKKEQKLFYYKTLVIKVQTFGHDCNLSKRFRANWDAAAVWVWAREAPRTSRWQHGQQIPSLGDTKFRSSRITEISEKELEYFIKEKTLNIPSSLFFGILWKLFICCLECWQTSFSETV